LQVHAFWKRFAELRYLLPQLVAQLARAHRLDGQDSEKHDGLAVELSERLRSLRSKVEARHIFQVDDAAVGTRLDNDVPDLFQIGEPAWFLRGERDGLPLGDRRLPDLAGPDRRLGLADRLGHVSGRQLACRELLGIEPDTQGIVPLAETDGLTDA